MKTYQVYISETYSGYVDIQAEDEYEAEEIARQRLIDGIIVPEKDFDGDATIEATECEVNNEII